MYSSIIEIFCEPKKYIDTITENAYNTFSYLPNLNNIITNINSNESYFINQDIIFYNNVVSFYVTLFLLFTISFQLINYYYYFDVDDYNKNKRIIELCKMNIDANKLLFEKQKEKQNKNIKKDVSTDVSTDVSNDNLKINKFYVNSLYEIETKNEDILSKIQLDNNYIVLLRVKMKCYISMVKTKYELHSKDIIYNKYNDFITKDTYMIMGINLNCKNKNINSMIVKNLNYINSITNELYKTEDFIVIAIGNSNNNSYNNLNISVEITKGFNNIKYERYNLKDIIFTLENDTINTNDNTNANDNTNNNTNNKNAILNTIKYTLTLPIHNIYNMLMDICNNVIFETKLYSIDKNNIEKWNNVPLNELNF